jgi:hypothetical protein
MREKDHMERFLRERYVLPSFNLKLELGQQVVRYAPLCPLDVLGIGINGHDSFWHVSIFEGQSPVSATYLQDIFTPNLNVL